MNAAVKIGMLGGGMVNQIGHLPFYLADKRCDILCVAESRPSLVEALRAQLGADRVVEDYRAMLADPRIEAVVISVPRAATGPLTLETLQAGKHVMAEKPMAHSLEQARRLVEAAQAKSLTYAIGYMKRYDPGVQAAKQLFDAVVAEGRLGRLLLARFYDFSNAYAMAPPAHVRPKESRVQRFETWPTHPSWLPERYRAAFGWFMNAASHDVNLMRYFFPGDLEVLSASCTGDTCVLATLRHAGDALAFEVTKTLAGRWVEGAEFLFERGRISLTIPSPMATQSVSEVTLDDQARGIVGERHATGEGWSFARQATGFVDALTGVAPAMTSGADALGDMELTERIWRKVAER